MREPGSDAQCTIYICDTLIDTMCQLSADMHGSGLTRRSTSTDIPSNTWPHVQLTDLLHIQPAIMIILNVWEHRHAMVYAVNRSILACTPRSFCSQHTQYCHLLMTYSEGLEKTDRHADNGQVHAVRRLMIVPILPAGQPNDIGTQTSFADAVLSSLRTCITRIWEHYSLA